MRYGPAQHKRDLDVLQTLTVRVLGGRAKWDDDRVFFVMLDELRADPEAVLRESQRVRIERRLSTGGASLEEAARLVAAGVGEAPRVLSPERSDALWAPKVVAAPVVQASQKTRPRGMPRRAARSEA